MLSVAENLFNIKQSLGKEIMLVAVSKTKPAAQIMEAYEAGQRDFGENKVQELEQKAQELPQDIKWHMIGHLQSNKVKYIAPFVELIHSVDKLKLLMEINKRALQNDRHIKVLLQVYIAKEESKFGLSEEELIDLLDSENYASMNSIKVVGLMGMATFTDDKEQVKNEFSYLKSLFDRVKLQFFKSDPDFTVLSMGMSGDYPTAIEAGSNMVRIGSSIFGER